jgi:pimeloyl-ACP methyl ester carboxylesterase
MSGGGRDLRDGPLEGVGIAGRGRAIAADLPDELAGGGLQFAGRRSLIGSTQGLDASTHGRRVHTDLDVRYGAMATVQGMRRFPLVMGFGVAIALGILLAVAIDVGRSGGPGSWLARHLPPAPYVAAGARIDIGARSLYLDCRGSGIPTIILEAGSGSDSSTWFAVHDELAKTTRTCAYDRAGRARSDPRPRHTLADAAADLRALLAAAGERGPFVVVGHSLGGAYGRVFAATYRGEMAGLVLVDAFNPDLEAAWVHPLLGALRGEYEARLDGLRDQVSRVDSLDWAASETQLNGSSLSGLPVEVLVAPRGEPRLDQATNATIADAWRAAFESLSPGHVVQTTAWGAGHNIHIDRPDLVIESARRVVTSAR